MEPAAQFGYCCSSDLLLKLIRSVRAFEKAQNRYADEKRACIKSSFFRTKHLYILRDIIGLSTFEEAWVMPCFKHGESLEGDFLDCVFKSRERIKKEIVEGGR